MESNNNELPQVINEVEEINVKLMEIASKHKRVSSLITPKAYVFQLMDFDYVKINYMRDIADREYPGWSWTIIKTEALGTQAYAVHGRLKWYDEGLWREGDMAAAHRIQQKSDGSGFVNVGNDIKSANTDCMKKAFNMYMNIADDVYRNQTEDTSLSEEEVENILSLAKKANIDGKSLEKTITAKVDNGEIHALNYKGSIAKLERYIDG